MPCGKPTSSKTGIRKVLAEEVEAWMDEALEHMDDGLDCLFTFINTINERTKHVALEMRGWQKFCRCFTGLSLFVIPVVMAIGLAFVAGETGTSDTGVKAFLQLAIAFLMFLSGSIGLPLYIHALWEAYFVEDRNKESFGVTGEIDKRKFLPSETTIDDDSLEKISEAGRRVNRRIMDSVRSELQRRISNASEVTQSSRSNVAVPGGGHDENLESAMEQQTGPRKSPEAETTQLENILREDYDIYGVKVIILNTMPDLTLEIEKKTDCEELKVVEGSSNFEVKNEDLEENVAEREKPHAFYEDIMTFGDAAICQDQIIGM